MQTTKDITSLERHGQQIAKYLLELITLSLYPILRATFPFSKLLVSLCGLELENGMCHNNIFILYFYYTRAVILNYP